MNSNVNAWLALKPENGDPNVGNLHRSGKNFKPMTDANNRSKTAVISNSRGRAVGSRMMNGNKNSLGGPNVRTVTSNSYINTWVSKPAEYVKNEAINQWGSIVSKDAPSVAGQLHRQGRNYKPNKEQSKPIFKDLTNNAFQTNEDLIPEMQNLNIDRERETYEIEEPYYNQNSHRDEFDKQKYNSSPICQGYPDYDRPRGMDSPLPLRYPDDEQDRDLKSPYHDPRNGYEFPNNWEQERHREERYDNNYSKPSSRYDESTNYYPRESYQRSRYSSRSRSHHHPSDYYQNDHRRGWSNNQPEYDPSYNYDHYQNNYGYSQYNAPRADNIYDEDDGYGRARTSKNLSELNLEYQRISTGSNYKRNMDKGYDNNVRRNTNEKMPSLYLFSFIIEIPSGSKERLDLYEGDDVYFLAKDFCTRYDIQGGEIIIKKLAKRLSKAKRIHQK